METDLIASLVEILKFLGLSNPAEASGWIVGIICLGLLVWRINVMDKKYENYVDKISTIIVTQETQWRALIAKNDEITFDMLEASTKTMSTLTEKINSIQLLLFQTGKAGK